MDRDLLNHLPVILAVARRKNFAAAASELGMGPSAVSHAVRLVEERLGVPLFARTTRSVALTEAGGWGARIRTSVWRNQNPQTPLIRKAFLPASCVCVAFGFRQAGG